VATQYHDNHPTNATTKRSEDTKIEEANLKSENTSTANTMPTESVDDIVYVPEALKGYVEAGMPQAIRDTFNFALCFASSYLNTSSFRFFLLFVFFHLHISQYHNFTEDIDSCGCTFQV
jgi:hypothetical protein